MPQRVRECFPDDPIDLVLDDVVDTKVTGELERDPVVVKIRDELIVHTQEMVCTWKELLGEIKDRWPEVLADMIDVTS